MLWGILEKKSFGQKSTTQKEYYMKTNKKLLIQTLIYLKDGDKSLEEALDLAKKETQLPLLDEIDVIRYTLVRLKLLKHNLRVGYYVENRQGIVTFSPNFTLQVAFIKDYLTEESIEMINTGVISNFEFDTRDRKKIFLYVGHSNWGKSFVLKQITDNNARKKIKILFDKIFRVRKMSNDDDEEKLLEFVKRIEKSSYRYYLIAFCPRQNKSNRTKEILSILAKSCDLFFFIQKNQFGSTNIIKEEEIESLNEFGIVNVLDENMEYPQRAEKFLNFIKRWLEIE